MSAPDFPKRLPEKLKAIREHLGMSPDQLAPFVNARTGAEILAYEKKMIYWLACCGLRNHCKRSYRKIIYDDRDLWFGHRVN